MLRGFVKNCASAMDAFGNLVSFLTEIDIRPLPATPDLPSGDGRHGEVVVQGGVVGLDLADEVRAGRVERRLAGREEQQPDAVVLGGQDGVVDGAGRDHVDVHLEPVATPSGELKVKALPSSLMTLTSPS